MFRSSTLRNRSYPTAPPHQFCGQRFHWTHALPSFSPDINGSKNIHRTTRPPQPPRPARAPRPVGGLGHEGERWRNGVDDLGPERQGREGEAREPLRVHSNERIFLLTLEGFGVFSSILA